MQIKNTSRLKDAHKMCQDLELNQLTTNDFQSSEMDNFAAAR